MTKHLKFSLRALASATALLGLTNAANAALTYTDGDVFLCFRATAGTGAATDYVVNLGPATQFTSASGTISVNLGGNILSDLDTIYGANWKTRSNVFWSVSGTQASAGNGFPNRTMFASRAALAPGFQSTPWTRPSLNGAGQPVLKMTSMATPGYTAGTTLAQTESTNSSKALIQNTSAANSYASFMPGGSATVGSSAFAYFNAATGIENTFSGGTINSVVDFYKLEPSTNSAPAVLVGAFRMNDSAQLTFTTDISTFQTPAHIAFQVASQNVTENGGSVAVNIVRSGNVISPVTVHLSTANGTAAAGTDFTGQTNTAVSFAANETLKTVNIPIADLPGYQGTRTFTGSLAVASGMASVVTPDATTISILDDEPAPATLVLSAASYSVAENGGPLTVVINRSGNTASALDLNFSTVDGTAVAGVDFVGQTNSVVSFASNETTKTVDVAIHNRPGYVGNRTFSVALSGGTNGGTVGTPNTASVTILETDPTPAGTFAFSAPSYLYSSHDALGLPNQVSITVNRTNGTNGVATVSLAQSGGNLDADDFSLSEPTVIRFADGVASRTITFPLSGSVAPLPGTIQFALSNPMGGAVLGAQSTATVLVGQGDLLPPKVVVTAPRAGAVLSTFDVTGSITDLDNIDRVEIRFNGGAPQLATLGTKTGTSTPFSLAGLTPENGANVVAVQAFDSKGTTSAVTTVKVTYVNERLAFVGEYNALAVPTLATPPQGNVHNASGLISTKITKTGAFTGFANIGGNKITFSGVIANNGDALFKPAYGKTFPLVSRHLDPIGFGNIAFNIAGDAITGTIGTIATFEGNRGSFNGLAPETTVDSSYLANGGFYTMVLPSKAQSGLTAAQFPQGDSVGTATILPNGKVTFKGTLADGTAFTVPTVLSKGIGNTMRCAFYAPLYKNRGSIAGKVTFSLAEADTDFSGSDFLWLKPDDSTALVLPKYYPAGWPAGAKVDLLGASYNAAPVGSSVFPGLNPAGEAEVQFAYGTPETVQTSSVLISNLNKITNVPIVDKSFSLAISAPKGALAGFFTNNSDLTKPKVVGTIYQKGAPKGAYGYSLSVVPTGGSNGTSGGVTVLPKP